MLVVEPSFWQHSAEAALASFGFLSSSAICRRQLTKQWHRQESHEQTKSWMKVLARSSDVSVEELDWYIWATQSGLKLLR
jgi:hypothetical protein